jgi:hypothetical protein
MSPSKQNVYVNYFEIFPNCWNYTFGFSPGHTHLFDMQSEQKLNLSRNKTKSKKWCYFAGKTKFKLDEIDLIKIKLNSAKHSFAPFFVPIFPN